MKNISLIIFISLFFKFISKCRKDDNIKAEPEECFNIVITEEDISEGNPDDYVCCYLKQLEVMRGECFLLNKKQTTISAYKDELNRRGISTYIIACSEEEMPEEKAPERCSEFNPGEISYCLSRSLSEEEKAMPENNNAKCCYLKVSGDVHVEYCTPWDPQRIEDLKANYKNTFESVGFQVESVEVACGDADNNSNENKSDSNKDFDNSSDVKDNTNKISNDSYISKTDYDNLDEEEDEGSNDSFVKYLRINDKLFYIIWLIMVLF